MMAGLSSSTIVYRFLGQSFEENKSLGIGWPILEAVEQILVQSDEQPHRSCESA